jgi:hypothetical protein
LVGHRGLLLASGQQVVQSQYHLLAFDSWSITGDGLIATRNGEASSSFNATCTGSPVSGNVYFEWSLNSMPATVYSGYVGLSQCRLNSSDVVTAVRFPTASTGGLYLYRSGTNSCGVSTTNGLYLNGTAVGSTSGYRLTESQRIGIAFNPTTREIWVRNGSGSWISGDPETPTGPTGTLSALEAPSSGNYSEFRPACALYNCNGGSSGTVVAELMVASWQFAWAAPSGFAPYAGV